MPLLLYVLLLFAAPADPARSPEALGTWKGESLCTVRNSPCHDEIVLYRITAPAEKKGKLVWEANKIVNGAEDRMGTLDCDYDAAQKSLVCPMNNGMWRFTVSGDDMRGTLHLPNGTLYRRISVKRQR